MKKMHKKVGENLFQLTDAFSPISLLNASQNYAKVNTLRVTLNSLQTFYNLSSL